MPLFIIVILLVYGAMHLYLYLKLHVAFPALGWWRLAIAGFLLLMTLAPVLVQLAERGLHFTLARVAGAVGYNWMAVIFWFFLLAAVGDLWNLLVHGVGVLAPAAKAALLPARPTLYVIAGIIAVALPVGLYQAQNIQIERVVIDVPDLPDGLQTLKVAQISDVHLGVHVGEYRFNRMLRLLEEARPDVIVSTGDFVDSPKEDIERFEAPLARLNPPLGKFAVLGNHEYFTGLDTSLEFHKAAGFKLLRAERVELPNGLVLAGVDDPAGLARRQPCFVNELAALPRERTGLVLLLKHQPLALPAAIGRYHLQLSGHAHGGQIFPWHLVTRAIYPYYSGLHELPQGSQIYANRGLGTWGPRVRLFAPPEVTVFEFRKSAKP